VFPCHLKSFLFTPVASVMTSLQYDTMNIPVFWSLLLFVVVVIIIIVVVIIIVIVVYGRSRPPFITKGICVTCY